MTLPIIVCFGVPRSSALMKSPAAGMNVRSGPATIPGADSGSVTRGNAFVGEDVQPGERANEVRDEERRDDEEQEEVPPLAGAERDPVDERVRQEERRGRRETRVQERAPELRPVVRERLREVGELPGELEGRIDPRLQRLVSEEPERHQEEDPEPEQSR